jgi:hypothetical protein
MAYRVVGLWFVARSRAYVFSVSVKVLYIVRDLYVGVSGKRANREQGSRIEKIKEIQHT